MTEKKKNGSNGKTRREFLKDAGILIGGTAIGSAIFLVACGGEPETTTVTNTRTSTSTTTTTATETETETMTQTSTETITTTAPPITTTTTVEVIKEVQVPAELNKLNINGRTYELKLEPNWTLQYVLHDILDFTGAKMMCSGKGQCGSCSVIMDGRPILSCLILATECEGHAIQTIEGIADEQHPIIESFINFDALQCGFCTPGVIVTAKALLDKNPAASTDEITEALASNLCICGSYCAWTEATQDAAGRL